jgi:EmrB/QacA subfamily drug resistance transporter
VAAGVVEVEAPLRPLRGGSRLAVATLCGLLFLTFLDNTIVSVALGSVQHSMHATVSELQWMVNGYALAFAALMLPFGAISDEFGRKRILLAGTSLFCVGSLVAGIANTPGPLIAGRVIMGVGAAASEPGTLSMLRQLFPVEPMRSRVFGIWAAVSGLALALGPVIGGALIGIDGWRMIFWFSLALGAMVLISGALVLPESSDPRARRLDISGSVLGVLALASVIYGIVRAEVDGYSEAWVILLLATSVVATGLFVIRQRMAANPLLDLRGFDNRTFAVANFAAFTTYFATFAVFLFTALYLQQVASYDGYEIAAQFLPLTGGMLMSALAAGLWTGRRGSREPMLAGCLLFIAGLLAVTAVISPDPNKALLTLSLGVVGIGIGLTVVPTTDAALAAAPQEKSGLAASATNTSRELGAVVGVAVLGAVVSSRLIAHLTASLTRIGIPEFFQKPIVDAIVRNGAGQYEKVVASHPTIKDQVVIAAHDAFGNGLHVALVTSAALMLLTTLLIFLSGRVRK